MMITEYTFSWLRDAEEERFTRELEFRRLTEERAAEQALRAEQARRDAAIGQPEQARRDAAHGQPEQAASGPRSETRNPVSAAGATM